MHREIAEVGATYTLRERNGAYPGNFASKNDALMLDNSIHGRKVFKALRHSVVQPLAAVPTSRVKQGLAHLFLTPRQM
jgi:hypothetical protein